MDFYGPNKSIRISLVLFPPSLLCYFSDVVSINLHQAGKLNVTLEFPSSWNELFPAEVLFISKTLLLQNEENALQTRPQLLKFFIDYRANLLHAKLPEDWLTFLDQEQAILDAYPSLDFIFIENDLTNVPGAIRLPCLGETVHTQPFENITCGEYEDCEIIAGEFAEEPSGELLARLAAILFRPMKNSALVPYMEYNYKTAHYYTYQAEKKAAKFLKLKPEQLYAIFIWYAGCRNQLPKIFKTVYEGGAGGEPDMLAFTNCIHSGAGVKNGSREKIRTMKLYEFMYDMEQEAIKAKELKEDYDRISNTS